ncbi:predicted protein, partial [Phaeodactylum tricornutum CCAP 1055/1]
LESRYKAHKQCVSHLLAILRQHQVNFSCVNRVELDRQHLADVDLVVAVGGDGTVLSSAHFLDHGTIPLLGINSDPNVKPEDIKVVHKKSDERRSHGALCMCTALDMEDGLAQVLYGGGYLQARTRIRCKVKSTFSETRLVPALNDLLIANPSPAAVSRFRLGWMNLNSLNVWSSGMWLSTSTGSTAAMAAAGGQPMPLASEDIQYLIREHMIEGGNVDGHDLDNGMIRTEEKMHVRWNSQKGRIFIDGSHLMHNLELGDEILIDGRAPPLKLF